MNQQNKPKTHLFSPHTDQCIYCGKSAQDDTIENTPCGSGGTETCEPIGNSQETRQARITREQEKAVRNFIETWNLSMPYHDIGAALNCGECNALHQMLLALGATQAAQALMKAHVEGDDEGDDPDHLRCRAEMKNPSGY